MIPIEIDFTREITASSAPTIESDKKAFSFFFSLFEGRREKDVAIGERKKVFAPYLKPFFPSIGFSAFSFEERKKLSKEDRLRNSYRSFLLFLAKENKDLQSLFDSVRYRVTYLS
ncbi:MAG: hypothetical protein MSA42_01150 [Mollicutes bacterium]|nr:hypothetical protein [Mollicutes bacterium]